jgi:hypothetical protein
MTSGYVQGRFNQCGFTVGPFHARHAGSRSPATCVRYHRVTEPGDSCSTSCVQRLPRRPLDRAPRRRLPGRPADDGVRDADREEVRAPVPGRVGRELHVPSLCVIPAMMSPRPGQLSSQKAKNAAAMGNQPARSGRGRPSNPRALDVLSEAASHLVPAWPRRTKGYAPGSP